MVVMDHANPGYHHGHVHEYESETRPKVLDVFCGPGGVGHAFADFDFYAAGVDAEDYREYYPYRYFQVDVTEDFHQLIHTLYQTEWDLIWISPPCPAYSRASYAHYENPKQHHPTFYDVNVRGFLHYLEPAHYVIENVVGCDDLRDPVRINGFGVGQPYPLERQFETSFPVPDAIGTGDSAIDTSSGLGESYVQLADVKGVDKRWGKSGVRSAIPKAYVQYLLHYCPSTPGIPLPQASNSHQETFHAYQPQPNSPEHPS